MSTQCPMCKAENPDTQSFCGDCGTQLTPLKDIPSITKTLETPIQQLTIGTLFASRYEILEKLGKGGMGEVYRVKDKKLDEEMALKLLKPEIAAQEGTIERFKNELKLARKIAHRNVCKMYDLHEEGEIPFITMEYVEGDDLKSLIKRKEKLSEKDAIALAKQVCEGLSEAHRLGVVHRDLKPQNIMIDDEGYAKVMDFGIARSVEAAGVTQTGIMIGTPDYISPEQAEGEEADHRSDIYSLGVILYKMMTGSVPFRGDTALSVALKHKAQLPQDPRKLNNDVSENLSRLILICMEKDRERRYQNAEALLNDLRNIEEGLPLGTKIRPRRVNFVQILIRQKLFIPVLIVILAVIVVAIWQQLSEKEVSASALSVKSSIAVLPFIDLSPQKDQEYFCDGLTEELINRLTRVASLRVPARTSSFYFKDKTFDIQEIGKRLCVNTVLQGSVRKAGNALRVTAQLIDVKDGYHIWSERYDRELDDVFAIQDEISLAIVEKLKIKLIRGEEARLSKRHTENREAYELYLKGRYFWSKRTNEEMRKGMEFFQQAIDMDPIYALAYVGLADSYSQMGMYCFLHPRDAFPKARGLAEKALEIDENLAEAHTSLAWISLVHDWDWTASESRFKQALRINPNYVTLRIWYSMYLVAVERYDEALEESKRALELDPLSLQAMGQLGWVFLLQRKYDQAIEQFKKTIELDPNYPISLWNIGRAYINKGMLGEAIEVLQKPSEGGLPWATGFLGYAYAMAGERDKAEKLLNEMEELSKKTYVTPVAIAVIYLGLGDKDKVFELYEKAFRERETSLPWINIHPELDSIRSDTRFKELLKKINLE